MDKKYYTCKFQLEGTLTIGVIAENQEDAEKIIESIFDDHIYDDGDIQVDTNSCWSYATKEVSRDEYRQADYYESEKGCKDILEAIKEEEDDE